LPIKAVIFDLDETLISEQASDSAALAAACELARERCGIDPLALAAAVRRRALELWQSAPTIEYCRAIGIASWEGLWGEFTGEDPNLRTLRARAPAHRLESWRRALIKQGVEDDRLARQLAEHLMVERRRTHQVFPDARPALEELRGRYRLGLITNGAPDVQRAKLDGSGLERYFESVLVSGEVGFGKPDARIFELALEQLAVAAGEAVMVGDSVRRDVEGALAAGIGAVWITRSPERQQAAPSGGAKRVHDLAQFCRLLDAGDF
jgi:putative hydrolase of the HAD superfamily